MIVDDILSGYSGAAAELAEAIGDGKNVSVFGIPFSARLLVSARMKKLMYVVSDVSVAREAYETFFALNKKTVLLLPRYDVVTLKRMSAGEGDGDRFSALYDMASGDAEIAVVTAAAFLQRYPTRERIISTAVSLEKGAEYDTDVLKRRLIAAGYKNNPAVTAPGEFSLRGDILDVWGAGAASAVRAEFFGDLLEDLRVLDTDGRSVSETDRALFKPFASVFMTAEEAEAALEAIAGSPAPDEQYFARYDTVRSELSLRLKMLPDTAAGGVVADEALDVALPFTDTCTIAGLFDPDYLVFDDAKQTFDACSAHLTEHLSRVRYLTERGEAFAFAAGQFFGTEQATECRGRKIAFHAITTANRFFRPDAVVTFKFPAMPSYARDYAMLLSDVRNWRQRYNTVIFAGNAETRASLESFFTENGVPYSFKWGERLVILDDFLPHGAIFHDWATVVIGTYDITLKRAKKALKRSKKAAFGELKQGDYVVHETHGIGLCEGIKRMSLGGGERDYIVIAYRDGDKLYLPAENMDSLSKYSGGEENPRLNKLGGAEFGRLKDKVLRSVRAMAIDLSRLYAEREAMRGRKYSADMTLDDEFARAFPFEETDDQLTAIEDGMRDLVSGKIMDRLLCGDVGYGKTEVALRLAFKVMEEGGQVAFVSPTTILARQHFETVKKRYADFGIRVVQLTRFNTPAETRDALEKLRTGKADIVCGTHRILSKDVKFSDLQMLILDEEQRFGVEDKEKLKEIRKNVNVLSMSATPIPRTLHMAMTGISDISVLDTPPAGRLPVQTYVTEFTETLCADAVEREISRGGQVFVVYNRVETIDSFAARLADITGRKVTVAHGQMDEKRLAAAIDAFTHGETDILVSSTIIENGIDLPRANTMIVADADKLGLSQLYQLRGRVGRSDRLAYVYFTYPEGKQLTDAGYKRLEAIMQYTELGSGFKIAMADLEIRGAGNVLGREQHGHMDKVGYDMYCKLLARAVAELKGEKTGEHGEVKAATDYKAFIPDNYITDAGQRFRAYSRIAETDSAEARAAIIAELRDVYGPVPSPCENLITVALVKNLAARLGASRVTVNKGAGEIVFLKAADIPQAVMTVLKGDLSARFTVASVAVISWNGNSAAASMVKFLLNCHKKTA